MFLTPLTSAKPFYPKKYKKKIKQIKEWKIVLNKIMWDAFSIISNLYLFDLCRLIYANLQNKFEKTECVNKKEIKRMHKK
jgi:hypothetical protein